MSQIKVTRPPTQTKWVALGLDLTERIAVLTDPDDATSLVDYYDDMADAEAAQAANASAIGLPTIMLNGDHPDVHKKLINMGDEWFDPSSTDIWWDNR